MLTFLFFFNTLMSVSIGLMKVHFEKDTDMIIVVVRVRRLRFNYRLFCVRCPCAKWDSIGFHFNFI